jgi:CubicO group peptidase (beta-lactamase class C family)
MPTMPIPTTLVNERCSPIRLPFLPTFRFLAALAVGHWLAVCAVAQSPRGPGAEPANDSAVETLADDLFNRRMKADHVPGAVFIVVKEGAVLFAKGYGYADLLKQTPVVADKTLFRVASVSKLFTATAVMQLAERGQVDLNADVNAYLRTFRVPDTFDRPVTLAHLLTHTGGFDVRAVGLAARTKADMVAIGPYLARYMPPRVLPPGEAYSYSNLGMTLAGYAIEEVAGVPFARYVDENILRPLAMHRSSFEQPPPFAADLATGYSYRNGTYRALPPLYSNIAPAGGLTATAMDMAHFMTAHLQDGRFGDRRILREETARQMHRQHFSVHARYPGRAYGFDESLANGRRVLEHYGGLPGFACRLLLMPQEGLGIFVAINSDEAQICDESVERFLDRFYPNAASPSVPRLTGRRSEGLERFAGSYRWNFYSRRTIGKLFTLTSQSRVTAEADGTLSMSYPGAPPGPQRWVEVEPLYFLRTDGKGQAAFRADSQGRIVQLFIGGMVREKVAWYESSEIQQGLLAWFALIFLSGCLICPTAWLVRLWRRRPQPAGPPVGLVVLLVSGLNLTFLIGWVLAFTPVMDLVELDFGVPPAVVIWLVLPLLSTALTGALAILVVPFWRNRQGSPWGRFHCSLVTLSAVLFVPFLMYWNLLGFHY